MKNIKNTKFILAASGKKGLYVIDLTIDRI